MKRTTKLIAASAVAVVCLASPALADEPWNSAGYEPTQASQAADDNDWRDEFPDYKDVDYPSGNVFVWNWR